MKDIHDESGPRDDQGLADDASGDKGQTGGEEQVVVEPEVVAAGEAEKDPAGFGEEGAEQGDEVPAEEPEEDPVERLTKEKEVLEDSLLRLRADFDNFRKRAAKERQELIKHGNESLFRDLLPVVDNIERILTYSFQEGNWKSFQEGIELVLSEIYKIFSQYGTKPIEALGKEFDPSLHEAMQRLENDETPAETVVEVFQKGYTCHGRLLRPSLVAVAVPVPKEGAEDKEPEADSEGKVEVGEEEQDEKNQIIN